MCRSFTWLSDPNLWPLEIRTAMTVICATKCFYIWNWRLRWGWPQWNFTKSLMWENYIVPRLSCSIDDRFSRFDMIPARDRRTDGQNCMLCQYRALRNCSMLTCDKNGSENLDSRAVTSTKRTGRVARWPCFGIRLYNFTTNYLLRFCTVYFEWFHHGLNVFLQCALLEICWLF